MNLLHENRFFQGRGNDDILLNSVNKIRNSVFVELPFSNNQTLNQNLRKIDSEMMI